MQNRQQPTTLTKHIRDGLKQYSATSAPLNGGPRVVALSLIEEEHFGFITRVSGTGNVLETFGDSAGDPFYLRSCEKPLQASLAIDYELNLTDKELALACGSNAGEKCHYETARAFAEKFGICAADLKCGVHKPLSKTRQVEMLLTGEKEDVFHNNCVGKHLTMLALCKKLGFSTADYDEPEHPLQKLIFKKVGELCALDRKSSSPSPACPALAGQPATALSNTPLKNLAKLTYREIFSDRDYPITKDGCGVPVMSMPLKNMVIGFLNLFCDPKYSKMTTAILNNPYIYGGEDRTDTKIIRESGLLCKVGAGGLCVVVNPAVKEGFVVKVSDCDMKARELVTIDYINRLGWGKIAAERSIKTLHGEIAGEIICQY